jgi:DNA-binding NarL/FixJ family response regulator
MSFQINILHHRAAVAEALKLCLHFSNYENIQIFETPADLLSNISDDAIQLVDSALFASFSDGHNEAIPFSLLVTSDDDPNIVEALYIGAKSFINISKGPEHFVNHVVLIAENKLDESSQLLRNFVIEKDSKQIAIKEEEYKLTKKEAQILKMMREGKHLKLIAQHTNTSYETIRTHVKRIYKKLEVGSASEAVIKAMKMKL